MEKKEIASRQVHQDRIEEKLAEVLAFGLSLKGRFLNVVKSISVARYPESQRAKVESRTVEYMNAILASDCIAAGNVDVFRTLTAALQNDLRQLEHEPVQKSQRDRWLAIVAHHWSGGVEIDELWRVLKADEVIVSVNYLGCTVVGPTGERSITREALRLRTKPGYSDKSDAQWVRMNGPEIRDPAEA